MTPFFDAGVALLAQGLGVGVAVALLAALIRVRG